MAPGLSWASSSGLPIRLCTHIRYNTLGFDYSLMHVFLYQTGIFLRKVTRSFIFLSSVAIMVLVLWYFLNMYLIYELML